MEMDQSSPTPAGSNIIPLLDRPQAREWLRQQLGAWLVDNGLSEAQAVDAAIMTGRHGFGIPSDVLQGALDQFTRLLAPCSDEIAIQALLKCHSKTIRKDGEPMDAEIMIEAYTEELREFPADVVEGVLRDWPKESKWFPAFAEIYPKLLQGVAYRVRARNWIEAEMSYGSSEQAG
jgi:hypothetical protein